MVQYASYVLLLGIGRMRAGTAQVAERQTKKGQALYWSGFESALRQGIFLPELSPSADSLTVSVQPPYMLMCS